MYQEFFGLSEKPFSIAPNPDYLFLSERHKEALAHLTFGLGESGGFVLLTGEVGTGKTTVTRAMLAELPETTHVALILNPMLSKLELLASICDELNIAYDEHNATLKSLTDHIKARLLENHANGCHTMLVIDEAQHLAPDVLEQLRLLTNLETNDKKLLQIILIGQPELQTLLKRNELRQLAQRITARYHLVPLSEQQVFEYVQFRLNKAGGAPGIFAFPALQQLYKLTAGIPRLINLVCDRAMMGAFAGGQRVINAKTIRQAAKEVAPELFGQPAQKQIVKPVTYVLAALVMLSVGVSLSYMM